MTEERRKELPHPWRVDTNYLFDRLERRIAATGYRLRERGYAAEMEMIYDHSVEIVRAMNRFLEVSDDDLDGMLDAIVDLNIGLQFYRYPVTRSRRFRERLSNHIGWILELAEARAPTEAEHGMLDRLLHADFPGSDAIRHQLEKYLVTTGNENGSLLLYPDKPAKVAVATSVPVWGEVEDEDGVMIYVRLHVIQGWIKELEISRDDDSRVMGAPESSGLSVHQA